MPASTEACQTTLPLTIDYESRDRSGADPNEARVEELRHAGLRPKDARRVERLERTLDLPDEQEELDRVRAAAVLRSDLKTRRKVLGEIVRRAADEEITTYEALSRLQSLEVVPAECDFARYVERVNDLFICYAGADPMAALRLNTRGPLGETYPIAEEHDIEKLNTLPEAA